MARNTLFLMITNLVQNFDICFPENYTKPNLMPRIGLTTSPPKLSLNHENVQQSSFVNNIMQNLITIKKINLYAKTVFQLG
jgi:hypothetical protein